MKFDFLKILPALTVRALVACFYLSLYLNAAPSRGPKLNPVQWSLSAAEQPVSPGSTVVLHLHADIAAGYHLYSLTTPAGGPIPTTIFLKNASGLAQVRVYQPAPNRHNDPNLNVPVETFSGPTDFPIQVKVKKDAAVGSMAVVAQIRYQACSDEICLLPVERTAAFSIIIQKGVPITKASVPPSYRLVTGSPKAAPLAASVRR